MLDSKNQQYRLRTNSKILFEFKSINNVVLRSDVSNVDFRNGTATCFVEVLQDPLRTFEEIQDGQGSLTLVGSLENKTNTEDLIPNKFLNAMNYRCVFPINIRKNATNADSPIVTNTEHRITTLTGKFSFADDVIPSTSNDPNSGVDYDSSGNISTNQFASSRPSSS